MVKHFIILSSSYSHGQRIAMHYVIDDKMNAEMLSREIKTIQRHCGEKVSISTHYIETCSKDWYSIVEKDHFFKDVEIVDSLVGFINFISEDISLKGIDIANYILSIMKCTHLQLEKLVYMCYADYLCHTGNKLFDDKIYAFRLGPVVDSVYNKYKGYKEIEDDVEISDIIKNLPARSRILFAQDGVSKLKQINETISKYSNYTAPELVKITHVPGGPWDSVNKNGSFVPIPDDIIKKHHFKELSF